MNYFASQLSQNAESIFPILVAVILSLPATRKTCNRTPIVIDFLEKLGYPNIRIQSWDPKKQNDIFFPSDQIGYSVGNAGSIMRTINGGTSWEVIQHYYLPEEGINKLAPTKAILESVYFINDSIGFAGDKEKIN